MNTDDIIVRRLDGLFFGFHRSILRKMVDSFIAPTLCVTRIVSGAGLWKIGNETVAVSGGDMVFLNNIEYRTFLSGCVEAESFWFSPGILSGTDESVSSRLFYAPGSQYTHILSCQKLHEVFQRITDEMTGFQSIALLTALTTELLFYALREYESIPSALSAESAVNLPNALRIADSIAYIHDHICDGVDVSQAARHAGLSREAFSRTFLRYVTIPPGEYITRCRISRFIADYTGDETVINLAMKCGFSSNSGFYKAFTRICGTSPHDYFSP